MSKTWIQQNWGVTAQILVLIFAAGGVYAGFVSLKADVTDIRASLIHEVQAGQKRDVDFAKYETRVGTLETKAIETDKKVAATEKTVSDMAGDLKYVVRWVEDQRSKEARKP